ncbi:carboxypeptidase S [Trametopsis cervina]|nr:carboxypeptidase S [Trametopsis cervina]
MRASDWKVVRLLRAESGAQPPKPIYSEKQDVEYGIKRHERVPRLSLTLRRVLVVALTAIVASVYVSGAVDRFADYRGDVGSFDAKTCPQVEPHAPSVHADLLKSLESTYETENFRKGAYDALSGAVQIPTEMFDDLKPPGEDPHWEVFGQFHKYLLAKFPRVHASLKKTEVNTYALVYHWQGSDDSLKPFLLTAHQDVVPVEPTTVDTWEHPPYSGLYDGEWLWGRGSCDDKSGLIASLASVESLLASGFKPRRTVVFAFGIDEERGGIVGASFIAEYLRETYGEDGFALLVDEGGGQTIGENAIVASPAVAEKGSYNMRIEVSTPGGHSSVPPPHTSIGILSSLIAQLEAHPHVPELHRTDTAYAQLECLAAHSPDFPTSLAKLVKKSQHSDKALKKLLDELLRTQPTFLATTATTQAADVIRGGVKVNALPENAYVIVNHRIAGFSSVGALEARVLDVLSPVAAKYNLTVDAFGKIIGDPSSVAKLTLSDVFKNALEPAPITPTTGSAPYELLSGVIQNVFATSKRAAYEGKKVIVAPSILLGNTDTKHYWALTKHIFRYSHLSRQDSYNGAHTVNEAVRAEGWIEMLRFFTQLILSVDETDVL